MMAACFSGENAFGFRPRFPGSGAGFAFAMPAPCYFWRLGARFFAAVLAVRYAARLLLRVVPFDPFDAMFRPPTVVF